MFLYANVADEDGAISTQGDGWVELPLDVARDDVAPAYEPPDSVWSPDVNPVLQFTPDTTPVFSYPQDDTGDVPFSSAVNIDQRPGDIRLPSWANPFTATPNLIATMIAPPSSYPIDWGASVPNFGVRPPTYAPVTPTGWVYVGEGTRSAGWRGPDGYIRYGDKASRPWALENMKVGLDMLPALEFTKPGRVESPLAGAPIRTGPATSANVPVLLAIVGAAIVGVIFLSRV